MSALDFKAHLKGRTTFEPRDAQWPMVTKTLLAKVSQMGPPEPTDNPLVHHLVIGYVWLANAETNLKRAKQIALEQERTDMVKRLEDELRRIELIKKNWPLEIV